MHAVARQAALFTSGTIGLLIFPFITYVPSSGALGDMLPKVRQFYHVGNLTCFVTCCQVARLWYASSHDLHAALQTSHDLRCPRMQYAYMSVCVHVSMRCGHNILAKWC